MGSPRHGHVFDIMKYATHDGPGIRTVIFFKGCRLRCRWCHNPEGQRAGPEIMFWDRRCTGCGRCLAACQHGALAGGNGAFRPPNAECVLCGACVEACPAEARTLVGRMLTAEQVMDEIGKDAIFYEQSGGGVTFSGGEPLAQAAFLMAVLQLCKREGYHTAVETTGFVDVKTLLQAGELTDLFLYDVKLMNSQVHRKFTGVSNRSMLANLRALSGHHGHVVVRVPVIPGVTDTAQNLRELREFLSELDGVSEVHLLPYHRHGMDKYSRLGRPFLMGEVLPPDAATMHKVAEQLAMSGKRVSVGGSPDP